MSLKVTQINDLFTDFVLDFDYALVGVKQPSLLDPKSFYLWFQLLRPPSLRELLQTRSTFKNFLDHNFHFSANCDQLNARACRFARAIGFKETGKRNGFLILET